MNDNSFQWDGNWSIIKLHIDHSHNAKNWCIMADFNYATIVIHKSNMDVAQILQVCSKDFSFGLFILAFWISTIIQQQLVAMLQRDLRFVHSTMQR